MATSEETSFPQIFRVPDEILCGIFLIIFDSSRLSAIHSKRGRRKFKDRGIIVTHVCKYWRSVALHYAPIWTTIMADVFALEQIEQYLIRSKFMKLTIYISMDRIGFKSTQFGMLSIRDMIMPHLSRIQNLTISGYNIAKSLRKPQFFIYSAVNVRSLSLESTCCSEIWFPEYFDGLLGPPSVGNPTQKFPCLAELHLNVVRPQAMLPWLNTLTRLCLQNQYMEAVTLLNVLDQCSGQLEYLKLSRVRIETTQVIPANQKIIELQTARDAVFISNMGLSTSVFPYLKFPEDVSWLVVDHLCMYPDPVGQLAIHLDNLPSHLLSKHAYLEIQVMLSERELNFVLCDAISGLNGRGKQQDYEIRVNEEFWLQTVERFFSSIPKHISSELEYLEIHFSGYTTDALKDHSFDMDLLVPLTRRTRNIYFLKLSLSEGRREDSMEMQAKLLEFFISLASSVDSIWPKIQMICFKQFDFRPCTKFWNLLLLFVAIWRRLGKSLRIERPFNFGGNCGEILRDVAGAFLLT